jgi:hypothetical protein
MKKYMYEIVDYTLTLSEDSVPAYKMYEVDQPFRTGVQVSIDPWCPDRSIIRQLKKAGIIRRGYPLRGFRIDGEPDYSLYIEYSNKSMSMPVLELRRLRLDSEAEAGI